jgi:hypothetical protein
MVGKSGQLPIIVPRPQSGFLCETVSEWCRGYMKEDGRVSMMCGDSTLSLLSFPVLQATTRSRPTKGSKGAEWQNDSETPEQLRGFEGELDGITYLEEKKAESQVYTRSTLATREIKSCDINTLCTFREPIPSSSTLQIITIVLLHQRQDFAPERLPDFCTQARHDALERAIVELACFCPLPITDNNVTSTGGRRHAQHK